MTLTPEDPRLTSYLLGELSPEEAAAIEKAIAEDPKLQASLAKFDEIRELIGDSLLRSDYQLHPDQKDAVRRSAVLADRTRKIAPITSTKRELPVRKILIMSLSVVVVIGLVLILNRKEDKPNPQTKRAENSDQEPASPVPELPKFAVGPENYSGVSAPPVFVDRPDTPEFPPLVFRNAIPANESAVIDLPVRVGNTSFAWVSEYITDQHKLPPVNAVRLEEFLNAFDLQPTGSAGITRGVSLSSETLICPWKPSALLVLVSMRGAANENHEISVQFHADPSAISRYRLLGFSTLAPEGGSTSQSLSTLAAKSKTTHALVIEPQGVSLNFGTIEWTVDANPPHPFLWFLFLPLSLRMMLDLRR